MAWIVKTLLSVLEPFEQDKRVPSLLLYPFPVQSIGMSMMQMQGYHGILKICSAVSQQHVL